MPPVQRGRQQYPNFSADARAIVPAACGWREKPINPPSLAHTSDDDRRC
ncbi:hypothetical protein EDWATA_01925 [Edwardsiella tarda ATCC 23685]|uniref:Uncharacterized protein n=1 Tax=Edwardsiella tarda ATCC 23685 TaxID=500638 RepID=D4F597_EDWTA|nr:hypothetical protein EDWATA_01925 [Edwardsiella tarda ATCC 23685]